MVHRYYILSIYIHCLLGSATDTNSKSQCNGNETKTYSCLTDTESEFNKIISNDLQDYSCNNKTICLPEGRSMSSSKTIIPVYNGCHMEQDKTNQSYINGEDLPLLQNPKNVVESGPKDEASQSTEFDTSEAVSGFYNSREKICIRIENMPVVSSNMEETSKHPYSSRNSEDGKTNKYDKSTQSFNSQDNLLMHSSECTKLSCNKTEQIKVFQNQACQTDMRPKRHVKFNRLEIDHSETQTPGIFKRSPINALTKAIAKRREGRLRSKSEHKLRQSANDVGDSAVANKKKRATSVISKEKKHVSLEAKRERKAAKTLAIVTGAFIACWLPFFILALIMPIFKNYEFNRHLIAFFLWLGYFNSTLNPMIYTIFSPEFRQAFQRILCGKSAAQNHRPRHLQ